MPLKNTQSWRNGVGPAGAGGRGRASRPMVQPSRRVAASRMLIMLLTEEQVNKEGLAWTVVGERQEPWGGTDPTPWPGVQEIKNRNSANTYYVPTPSTVNRPTPRCGWGRNPRSVRGLHRGELSRKAAFARLCRPDSWLGLGFSDSSKDLSPRDSWPPSNESQTPCPFEYFLVIDSLFLGFLNWGHCYETSSYPLAM